MKRLSFWHTAILIATTLLTWVWTTNLVLSQYSLQLTGALVIAYFAFKFILRSSNQNKLNLPSTLILNIICLLLVFSSGGISSPLFFILLFLVFALALLFEPIQAAIVAFILVSLFVFQSYQSMDTTKIVNLLSLILITPLAILFSRNYLEILEDRGTINLLENDLQRTQIDSLMWVSTQAKPSLIKVLETLRSTTDMINDAAVLERLRNVQQDIISLYSSADSLESVIEETSNNVDL